jgi:hypothetical protein
MVLSPVFVKVFYASFVHLHRPSEAYPRSYVVPGGNPPRELIEFAVGWGGAASNPGPLRYCQARYHDPPRLLYEYLLQIAFCYYFQALMNLQTSQCEQL